MNAGAGTDPLAAVLAETSDLAEMATSLMRARQTILPKRLLAPGPDRREMESILDAASTAPDHGRLLPWRFIVVPQAVRGQLGDAFAAALIERDPAASSEQVSQAREKAQRAPFLMLVVVDGRSGDPAIDCEERIVSAGCAVQNVLLMATALGYGSALTSGKALKSAPLRTLFKLEEGEHALCFVSIGTVQAGQRPRVRPSPLNYVTCLAGDAGPAPAGAADFPFTG